MWARAFTAVSPEETDGAEEAGLRMPILNNFSRLWGIKLSLAIQYLTPRVVRAGG